MDLAYIKKLIKILSESNVDEIEIEEDGKKIRLVKNIGVPGVVSQNGVQPLSLPLLPQSVPPGEAQRVPPSPPSVGTNFHEIKSPIVGTFYKSPGPDAAPFVDVGSTVQPGTVLCIVEAMKLMNEIESDAAGKVVKVLVENGQPVEYGQPLFLIEKL
jgi:acetyl-CoA carboxylase biotin carboxyl carrier protein